MAVVTFGNAKGGVGKTTLSVNAAVELAHLGYRTILLDCDLNQHATQFGLGFRKRNPDLPLDIRGKIRASNVVGSIRAAEAEADIVIIDLPAGTSDIHLKAMTKSQLVIIPAQKTVFDVRDATRTALQIAEAEDVANTRIHSALVWSRVPARFETTTERDVRNGFLSMITDAERPIFRAGLLEYDAFPAGFALGWVPRQVAAIAGDVIEMPGTTADGKPRTKKIPNSAAKAAENIEALTREILERLGVIADGQDPGSITLKPDYEEQLRKLEEELAEEVE